MYTCKDCGKEFDTNSYNKSICPQCMGRRGGKANAWPARIKPKKAKLGKNGYYYYTITMLTPEEKELLPDDSRTILVHRLVKAKSLGYPIRGGQVVMHINGNKTDNRPENLEVGTPKKNTQQHMTALIAHEQWKKLAVGIFLALSPR